METTNNRYSHLKGVIAKPDPELQARVRKAREQEAKLKESIERRRELGESSRQLGIRGKAIISAGVFMQAMCIFNDFVNDWHLLEDNFIL